MKVWFKRFAIAAGALLLFAAVLLSYSYFVEPRQFVLVNETLAVPNWSSSLNGLRVVAISDIHAGSNYVTIDRLRFLVEQANAQDPDIVVLLGDYISESKHDPALRNNPYGTDRSEIRIPVPTIADIIGGLRAKHGVYAVIGNHDEWHNAPKITAEFERVGITVLENQVSTIDVNGETINIWGIEDLWKNKKVPAEAYEAIQAKRNIIALTHNPDSLLNAPPGISLMFSGHTHGGQLNWPIFGPIPAVNDKRFMDGHVVVDGKHVYVTSGFGTSVIPFRLRVPPEIAVVKINSAG